MPSGKNWLRLRAAGIAVLGLLLGAFLTVSAEAQQAPDNPSPSQSAPATSAAMQENSQGNTEPQPATSLWQYGAFADEGYLYDFDYPPNHIFRSRSTTFKVNELDLNMALAYVKKDAAEKSRWGVELTLQAGRDFEQFGFSPTAPNVPDARWLRHFGPADVSYLAPVGNGLTIQAGLFSSLLGYDSLYARDNFTYTRPWAGDYTPYLMFGVNASYPFSKKLTGVLYLINGYSHLAQVSHGPSVGGQVAYKFSDRLNFKETLFYGPQQRDASLRDWRFLSDSIAEWKPGRATVAFEYQVGTEGIATTGRPRIVWTLAQVPLHWAFNGHWSVTERPEFFWDPQGRLTGFEQLIASNTESLEYRWSRRKWSAIARLEHRFDNSQGKGGGFFSDQYTSPGVVALTPSQNLLILGVILSYDSRPR